MLQLNQLIPQPLLDLTPVLPLDLQQESRGIFVNTNSPIQITIVKEVVKATSRKLSAKWRLVWPRLDKPKNLDFAQFPHSVSVFCETDFSFDQVLDWCQSNIGNLDQSWTYKDSGSIMFREESDSVQFKLTFG